MPKAFICGCAGLALDAGRARVPPRRRSVGPDPLQAQRRRPRSAARADRAISATCVGRADAPVLIDQEGGRVQRMAPPHWRAYPAAARDRGGARAARGRGARRGWSARLIAHDLREVGINVDCAPVLDVAEPRDPRRRSARAPFPTAQRGRGARPRFRRGAARGRRRAGDQAHARPRARAGRQPSRAAGRRRDARATSSAISCPSRRSSDLPMAMSAHVVFTRARSRSGPRPRRRSSSRDHARRDRFRRADHERRRVDEGAAAARSTSAPRAIFDAGLDIVAPLQRRPRGGPRGRLRHAGTLRPRAPPRQCRAGRGPPQPFDVEEAEAKFAAIGRRSPSPEGAAAPGRASRIIPAT